MPKLADAQQFCFNGHKLSQVGITKSGACKACRQVEGRKLREKYIKAAAVNLGEKCAICGLSFTSGILILDHITPIRVKCDRKAEWRRAARGDTHNLQLLCPNDHARKTNAEKRVKSA